MDAVLVIVVSTVVSVLAVVAAVVVWRDDHKWRERRRGADDVTEPGPYPLHLRRRHLS